MGNKHSVFEGNSVDFERPKMRIGMLLEEAIPEYLNLVPCLDGLAIAVISKDPEPFGRQVAVVMPYEGGVIMQLDRREDWEDVDERTMIDRIRDRIGGRR